ncbi:MAG: hypothetical protein EOO24_43740, partial [Comamonadaceae bacterium]
LPPGPAAAGQAERRTERALIGDYRATIEEVLRTLDAANHGLALELAAVPDQIKGYGHVKEKNLAAARPRWDALLRQWRDPAAQRKAA